MNAIRISKAQTAALRAFAFQASAMAVLLEWNDSYGKNKQLAANSGVVVYRDNENYMHATISGHMAMDWATIENGVLEWFWQDEIIRKNINIVL